MLTTGTPPGVGMGRRDAAGQPAPVFLKAGDVVLSGSFVRAIEAPSGSRFQADFGAFGSVSINFE